MTKRLVWGSLAVMTTLMVLIALWQFRQILIYILISLTLAAALRPLINRLHGRGVLARVAWILLYLVVLGVFAFSLFLAGKTAINDIQRMAHTVSEQDVWKLPVWLEGSSFQQALIARLPPPSKLFEAVTGEQGQLVLPTLLGITQGIAGVVSAAFVILFLSIYWMVNQTNFERLWLSLLPPDQRKRARDIWRTIELDLGAYIRTQIAHSLLAGVLFGLGYWALGSHYPTLLALAGALACLIPVVGVVLAVIPPLLLGLLTGVQFSLLTVAYTIIVLIVLGIWVKPRLFNRIWDNPILTLVILIAMANDFGLIGIIVAPPISAIFQILWNLLGSQRLVSGAAAQVADLKERQERVRETILALDEPPLPLITSSLERLTRLIEKAEPILQVVPQAETSGILQPATPRSKTTEQDGHA